MPPIFAKKCARESKTSVQNLGNFKWLIRELFKKLSYGLCIPNGWRCKFVTELRTTPFMGIPLSMLGAQVTRNTIQAAKSK